MTLLGGVVVLAAATSAASGEAPALKDLAPKTMRIGVALNQKQSDGKDAAALAIVTRQFDQVSPENLLKWEAVHPEPGRYDFEPADRYVELGRSHGMFVVGHVLLWHQQTPAWVFAGEGGKKPDRDTLLARLGATSRGRRPLPRPHRRLGRGERGPRGGRDAAQDALARGDRRGLRREGLRVRARGRPRRGALLQRLQPLEAGQA